MINENRQLEHHEVNFKRNIFPIVIICENISVPENVGMVFRIADAFGAEKIYLTGESVQLPNKKIEKTSRSTINFIPHEYVENTSVLLKKLNEIGYKNIALEITTNSIALQHYKCNVEDKIALVIGAESKGVSEETLKLVDDSIHIEMFGRNSSMNVTTALSVALYEITKREER